MMMWDAEEEVERLQNLFNEIRRNLPPTEKQRRGMHVAFIGWSLPPSTAKELQRLCDEALGAD